MAPTTCLVHSRSVDRCSSHLCEVYLHNLSLTWHWNQPQFVHIFQDTRDRQICRSICAQTCFSLNCREKMVKVTYNFQKYHQTPSSTTTATIATVFALLPPLSKLRIYGINFLKCRRIINKKDLTVVYSNQFLCIPLTILEEYSVGNGWVHQCPHFF